MFVFETEVFEVFGIGTLVWFLTLVVLLVRAFARIKNRSARHHRSRGAPNAGPVPPASSPPVVTHNPGRHGGRQTVSGSGPRHADLGSGDLVGPGGASPSREEWDSLGFSQYGVHRQTGTLFDPSGFDIHGYDREGYDRQGFDFQGYNRRGSRRRD